MTLVLVVLGCRSAPPADAPSSPTPVPVLDTGLPASTPTGNGFRLEVGPAVPCTDIGRDARYFEPLDLGPAPGMAHPEDWRGSGLVAEDFDGDGRLELFAAGVTRSSLFERTDGGWVDRAAIALAGLELADAVGGVAGDYDGDGDQDLFVTRYGRSNVLLRNDAGVFTDVTASAGVGVRAHRTAAATWADVDGDGWLDLIVGDYGGRPPDAVDPDMPPGDSSELWHNLGDGTFADLSDRLPPAVHDAYTFTVAAHDLDGDGLPELFHVADFGWVRPSTLLWNRGAMELELDDGTAGFHPNFAGMGLGIGDLNGDGLPDMAQSSYRDISLLISLEVGFSTSGITWVEYAQPAGLAATLSGNQAFGWGTELGDLDLDGDLDLVMGFGAWSDYLSPSNQPDGLWLNQGSWFAPPTSTARWGLNESAATRGVLLADLDGDGWLDVAKRLLNRPVRLHASRCAPIAHSVRVAVRDEASPNTHGIGASVRVQARGAEQIRWQAANTSLFSGGPAEVHFGLGDAQVIDRLEVRLQDGTTASWEDLPADRRLVVTRCAGASCGDAP